MNSFQILDREGQPLTISELDKQAAEFWNKDISKREYANPFKEKEFTFTVLNWYDVIGRHIASKRYYAQTWENVINSIIDQTLQGKLVEKKDVIVFTNIDEVLLSIKNIYRIYQPFLDLINYWADKGYTPKQIKD
jgi:hypothetical protein